MPINFNYCFTGFLIKIWANIIKLIAYLSLSRISIFFCVISYFILDIFFYVIRGINLGLKVIFDLKNFTSHVETNKFNRDYEFLIYYHQTIKYWIIICTWQYYTKKNIFKWKKYKLTKAWMCIKYKNTYLFFSILFIFWN